MVRPPSEAGIARETIGDERPFFAADRAVIEVRGRAAVADGAGLIDFDELKPLGNDELTAAAASDPAVLDGLLQVGLPIL